VRISLRIDRQQSSAIQSKIDPGSMQVPQVSSPSPDGMNAFFVSDFKIYPPTTFFRFALCAIWADYQIQKLVPGAFKSWLMNSTDIQRRESGLRRTDCSSNIGYLDFPIACADTHYCGWQGGIITLGDCPYNAVKLMEMGES
jgi:hypothetical protein